jgi:hypothetical protein
VRGTRDEGPMRGPGIEALKYDYLIILFNII